MRQFNYKQWWVKKALKLHQQKEKMKDEYSKKGRVHIFKEERKPKLIEKTNRPMINRNMQMSLKKKDEGREEGMKKIYLDQ